MTDTTEDIEQVKTERDGYRLAMAAALTDFANEVTHVQIAHGKILAQREQLRTLHGVIARRKHATRRLRDYVDAVKQLHRPITTENGDGWFCKECSQDWPCRTNKATSAVLYDSLPDSLKEFTAGYMVVMPEKDS